VGLAIQEEPIENLAEHGTISIAFVVDRVLDVTLVDGGLGGLRLVERTVEVPWTKDYDAIEGEGPTRWATRWDVSGWGLVAAHEGDSRVGGAVIAFDTPKVDMLRGRRDLAVLWDLRVAIDLRSRGIGALLFGAAEGWARARGCQRLEVETQNINVAACRFYQRMGCGLARVDRFAYPGLDDEVQLVWAKAL
jgi:GNAT superfamily N-acetyltransferase